MKKIKGRKKILLISFIIVFILIITIAYNSYSATKEYFLGDTNKDNEITLSDELMLLRHIYSLKSEKNNNWKLTGDAAINADINEDQKVDMSDVLYIKRYLLSQKDSNIAKKHSGWTKLCKKVYKGEAEIIKSYTLEIKPGNQTYTKESKSTMTVTAPEVSYKVSFEGNGGTTPESQKSIRNFVNWTLSGSGKINNKNEKTTTYTFGKGNATLTANYNKEGNTIILPNSQKEEYVVEGWYDTQELKNKIGNVGDNYTPKQDITLYAKWEKRKIEPTNIELSKKNTTIDISENKTEKITAKIIPENSNYNTKITWTSSNPDVATISEDGEITGISNGRANIIAKTENGKNSVCEVTVQTSPTGINIDTTEKTIDLSENKTFTIKPKVIPETANVNNSIKIKTSNSDVATISENGMVTGISNGKATITFYTSNGRFATCNVNVETSPTGITLDKKTINIDSDDSITQMLTAKIQPETSSINTNLTWTSSNPSVATVSNKGLVTGKQTGTSTITVKTENGKTASCDVKVTIKQTTPTDPTTPTNITLNKTTTTIDLSNTNTEKLIATTNSTEKLTWNSSNINVATISDDGLITGKANGKTTITVSDKSGASATCEVTVQTSPTDITLNMTEKTLDISTNKTFTITPTILPLTANVNKEIQIESSNSNVAKISKDGEVTALSNGTTVITFSITNGKTAKCNVKVQTSPQSITLNETKINIDTSVSSTKKLEATINPSTSNIYTGLTWKSNNPNIATVTDNGLVIGKAAGTTKITVETENGKTASCDVEVTTKQTNPSNITLNKEIITLDLSESSTEKLIATTEAEGGLNWSSDNSNVATVSRDGTVTGKSNGKATITVIDSNGAIATCEVTVQTSPTGISLNITEQTLDLSGTKTFTIEPKVEPSTANVNNKIFLESKNPNIATVTEDGKITGLANGTATIVAKTSNGKEVTCKVTVQTSPTGISLNTTEQTLDLSGTKTFKIVANLIPSTANVNNTLYAKSENNNIAEISEDGTITGISNGNTTVTIETENGKKATCSVLVQTSPSGIYFAKNKDDSTKYLSVKKGEDITAKAIIEPSTANVNTDITYSISAGNSKVASIDSNTGNISGKQAGVVTIKAKTANEKSTTIKLNVKIGNEVFDTDSTIKLKANTSENLLYSKAVDFSQNTTIGDRSHLQTFAVSSSGDIYYCSYPGGETGTLNTTVKMNISIGHPNETPYKCMTVNYFGHGSGFDLESAPGGGKIWIDSVTQGNKNEQEKYDNGYAITRLQWENKSEYYFAAGTVRLKKTNGTLIKEYKNAEGENFIFTNNGELKALRAAVDETNRIVAIKRGNYYYVFDLDEALAIDDKTYEINSYIDNYKDCIIEIQAKDLDTIKPLTKFNISAPESEDDVTWHAWQGFELDGDYIYIGEGGYTSKTSPQIWDYKAYVSAFDYMYAYNGKKLAKKKTEVVAVNDEWNASKKLLALMGDDGSGNYRKAQLEGIRVTTQGGVKELFLGFDSEFLSKKKRSANILKYSY